MPAREIAGAGGEETRERRGWCVMTVVSPVEVKSVGRAASKEGEAALAGQGSGSRRVVLPVDGSTGSEEALRWAARNILREGDVALVVSAMPRNKPSVLASGTSEEIDSWNEEVRRRKDECEVGVRSGASLVAGAARRLQAALDDDKGPANVTIKPVVLDACNTIVTPYGGNTPASTIAAFSEGQGADAIVMGSRGLGSGKKMLLGVLGLGSVSEEVQKIAMCPVTIVPPTEK